ncbi:MAG: HNH endonuclease signature motif containing protein [Ilumatobacteraceae bacterium]
MELGDVLELVRRVAAAPAQGSRAAVAAGVADARRLRSWVEAHEARLAAQVVSVASFPEKFIADAGGGSLRDASVVLARAAVAHEVPGLLPALSAGTVTGEHLDVVGGRLARLEGPVRERVLADAAGLGAGAVGRSPERYASFVRERVRLAERAEGTDRLAAQQASVALSWRLAGEGMHEWRLLLDPMSAAVFDQQVSAQVEALFHDRVPEGCPANPLARQAFLRAHALLSLVSGGGARAGRPEVIVVVDARDADGHGAGPAGVGPSGAGAGAVPGAVAGSAGDDRPDGEPMVDWGLPVEVPVRVLAELFGRADVHTVVVRNGIVLHAPGSLQLGRSTRLANRAQRRVLRGLYATCAVPGCAVRYDHTSIHHVRWWRHGGRTDLDNLLPLCSRHHHLVHEGGWLLSLLPDRTLTVSLPDGTVMSTGPPLRRAA